MLTANSIFKNYGSLPVLKGVDINIKKGEIVALIGHSGCGKSTLLNTISGFAVPTMGEVVLNYKTVFGPGPDRGIVFQNYSLLPWLTVYENVYEAVHSVLTNKTKAEKKENTRENKALPVVSIVAAAAPVPKKAHHFGVTGHFAELFKVTFAKPAQTQALSFQNYFVHFHFAILTSNTCGLQARSAGQCQTCE